MELAALLGKTISYAVKLFNYTFLGDNGTGKKRGLSVLSVLLFFLRLVIAYETEPVTQDCS